MRKFMAVLPCVLFSGVMLLAACNPFTAPSVGVEVTGYQNGLEGARQHCLMMLKPHIPVGTPALESKLVSGNDAPNGDKVLRLPYVYGTTNVRMEARCQYSVLENGQWQFSRLTLTPRYPAQ